MEVTAQFGPTSATNRRLLARLIPWISRARSELAVCAIGMTMPDRACRFALRPVICRNTPSRTVSPHAQGGDTRPQSPIPDRLVRPCFVGDLVGASPGTGHPRWGVPDDGDQRIMSLIRCACGLARSPRRSPWPALLCCDGSHDFPSFPGPVSGQKQDRPLAIFW